MLRRRNLVLAAVGITIAAMSGQAQPSAKPASKAGGPETPEQRVGQMLDMARMVPPPRWPMAKPQMVQRITARIQEQNAGAAPPANLGDILDKARSLSANDYAKQKPQLIGQLLKSMKQGTTGEAPKSLPLGRDDQAYSGKLFDAHLHFLEPRDVPPAEVAAFLKEAGISGAWLIVPSRPMIEDMLAGMQTQDPDFFYPAAMVSHDEQGALNFNETGLRLLEQELQGGRRYAIGEVPIRHPVFKRQRGGDWPADGPVAIGLLQLAAKYHVPINVHVDHESSLELDRALTRVPDAKVVWAHCGDAPPAKVRQMLRSHANLFADISCRSPFFQRSRPLSEQSLTNTDGTIKSEWKSLFEDLPDRFVFGSDIGGAANSMATVAGQLPRHRQLKDIARYYRSVLGQIAPEAAEKIAWRNAQTLLALEVGVGDDGQEGSER